MRVDNHNYDSWKKVREEFVGLSRVRWIKILELELEKCEILEITELISFQIQTLVISTHKVNVKK